MPVTGVQRTFGEAASGAPASIPFRNEMESSFGEDFSGVKAYLGRVGAMDRLNAHAAVSGEQVVFGALSPDKELVAHELAHVVQQRRSGSVQLNSVLSAVDEQAELEAASVAARAAAGERVRVSAAANAAVHRDIKDKDLKVPLGHFEIDMTKVESKGFNAGEAGTILFQPNDKAPDSKSIRLSQAARVFDVDTKAELHWSKTDPFNIREQATLNKMQTTAGDQTHVTVKGETLKAIAETHYGEPSRFAEVFNANKKALAPTMKVADGDKGLPENLSLVITKAVAGGFFIDHTPRTAKVRVAKKDPPVAQDYVLPGHEIKGLRQHGSKAGEAIEPAIMDDAPGGGMAHLQYTFETLARSDDVGIHYGTLHWGFDADPDAGKVTKETHRVAPGVSDTYRAALDEFNKFYKNPPTGP